MTQNPLRDSPARDPSATDPAASPGGDELPGLSWAVAALCLTALVAAVHSSVLGALGAFLPPELAGSGEQFGFLLTVGTLAGALGAMLLGPLLDSAGRRAVLLSTTALFALASFAHLLAGDFVTFCVARAAAGFVGGAAYTASSVLIADLVPYGRRGRAMTLFSATVFLATPVGLPVAVALARAGVWRGIFVIQGVLALVALVLCAMHVPDGRSGGRSVDGGRPRAREIGRALVAPGVPAALASAALYSGAFFVTVQFSGRWLHDSGLLPREHQLWMWIFLGVGMAASVAIGGLVDRVGKRNFVLLSTGIVGLGILALGRVDSLVLAAVVGLPVALVATARAGALLALMTALVPARARGSLMGVRSGIIQAGMAGMGAVGGVLSDSGGFEALSLGMASAIGLAFVIVWLGVREPSS